MGSGSLAEFEIWLRDMAGPGYRLAFAMLQDRALAEDALQEATIKAWRHFHRLDRDRPPLPWFLTIVANCCRTHWRSRWRSVVPLDDALRDQKDDSAAAVQREDLRQALLRLNQEDRLIVVLHFYLDLPLAEVAEIAGMKLGTLKTRLYRAVRSLRPDVRYDDGLL